MSDKISQINPSQKIKPFLQQKVIENYFIAQRRYMQLGQKSRKIISMIEKGSLSIQSETPYPQSKNRSSNNDHKYKRRVNASFRLRTQPQERQFARLELSPSNRHNNTLSKKNKRFLEALMKKYEIFQSEIESISPDEQTEKILVQLYSRLYYYRDILKGCHRRMPVSWVEEQFLDQSEYNLALSFQMQTDLSWVKQQAYKFQCSLYRKDKFYDDLSQLKKRVELQSNQCNILDIKSQTSDMKRQTSGVKRQMSGKQRQTDSGIKLERNILQGLKIETQAAKLRERRRKIGADYLRFSKQVGLQSSEIYKRQKGNVSFIKQMVHHYWKPERQHIAPLNQKSAQSALS